MFECSLGRQISCRLWMLEDQLPASPQGLVFHGSAVSCLLLRLHLPRRQPMDASQLAKRDKRKKRRIKAGESRRINGTCGYHRIAWAGSNLKDHLFPLCGWRHLPPDQVTQTCRRMWGNQACPSRTTSYLSIKPAKIFTNLSAWFFHPSKFLSGVFLSGVIWMGKF